MYPPRFRAAACCCSAARKITLFTALESILANLIVFDRRLSAIVCQFSGERGFASDAHHGQKLSDVYREGCLLCGRDRDGGDNLAGSGGRQELIAADGGGDALETGGHCSPGKPNSRGMHQAACGRHRTENVWRRLSGSFISIMIRAYPCGPGEGGQHERAEFQFGIPPYLWPVAYGISQSAAPA